MLLSATLFIVIATAMAVINHIYIKLPSSIGLMVGSLVASLLMMLLVVMGANAPLEFATSLMGRIDVESLIMDGMLSFLLFAGALHVDFNALNKQRSVIIALASAGVIITTFLIGGIMFGASNLFGFQLSFLHCLIFGALISPTDPIAVIGILKKAGVPKSLELKIAGESLFNDGTAVVLSVVLAGMLVATSDLHGGSAAVLYTKSDGDIPGFSLGHTLFLFVGEVVGGIGLGILLGFIAYFMMKKVDDYKIEIMITLSLVMGGYLLAQYIHVSGPLAMVAAGLLIGNHGKAQGMSEDDIKYLDNFWEMLDEILNSVLFVLIGLEILVIYSQTVAGGDAGGLELNNGLLMGLIAIPVVLLSRFISISGVVHSFKPFRAFSDGAIKIMTWGGLRGGISIALCLALPDSPERHVLLIATYIVVVFSILVQGLTIGKLVEKVARQ